MRVLRHDTRLRWASSLLGSAMFAFLITVFLAMGLLSEARAQFPERIKDRLGRTIGYLQPQGDRTIVQDRCYSRLGWVIYDGMNQGTYSAAGEKLAGSPLPFMLLSKPNPSCPTPVLE